MTKKKIMSKNYIKTITDLHLSLPFQEEDFPEYNRCETCKRIPGVTYPGVLEPGIIKCLKCIAEENYREDPAQFMIEAMKTMNPISKDMCVRYKDEYFEDKKP